MNGMMLSNVQRVADRRLLNVRLWRPSGPVHAQAQQLLASTPGWLSNARK